jgi:hypothetical protein
MPRLSKIGAAALAAFGWTSGGAASVTANFLVIAGGGGGGRNGSAGDGGAGGGGAGGYRTETASLNTTLSYVVTVGAGGAGGASGAAGSDGGSSVFNSLTSAGGGGGGRTANSIKTGRDGGSGGGAGYLNSGSGTGNTPSTSPSQGNNGGLWGGGDHGGGGGGAGAAGSASGPGFAGAGGAGTASSITGSSVTRAGGGGGGAYESVAGGGGGSGGGGAGGNVNGAGGNGSANTGGGGGGGGGAGGSGLTAGGTGGAGVVIISYPSPQKFGGGIVTTSGANTIHTFQTSGTLSPLSSLTASALIIAGGGGGGYNSGGGGGAGGFVTSSGITIDANSIYLVTVGAGGNASTGSGQGTSGGNSSFSLATTTAVGGGLGGSFGSFNDSGLSGGSGGGASGSGTASAGTATAGQGFNGGGTASGAAGGGGGSSQAGSVGGAIGGAGGNGTSNSISGTATTYAGGGGGGSNGGSYSTAGTGGAGRGGYTGAVAGTAATANTGSGGGGGGQGGGSGGAGGSGIVIISYAGSTQLMAGGTVTITGGNVIHTFNSSGYLTPIKLVGNSLRFRSSASAYLSRNPTSAATSTTKGTISLWFKGLGQNQQYLVGKSSGTIFYLYFNSSNQLVWQNGGVNTFITTQVFRDPAAWYHLVASWDTTQANSSNRQALYLNGQQITAFGTTNNLGLNAVVSWFDNDGNNRGIGSYVSGGFFDGYMTEINAIDGQALTPNSFGTFNSFGVWQPITYGGSYGTNGFYLPFSNTTSTTTLGFDFSPQGNNWTTNNISLTAGSTYDAMTDAPTLTSATAANYCVINPLVYRNSVGQNGYSNGNLTLSGLGAAVAYFNMATIGIAQSSDKFYWECQIGTASSGIYVGVTQDSNFQSGNWDAWYDSAGGVLYKGGTSFASVATATTNDVIGIAYDSTANTCAFYKNNTLLGTVTGLTSATMFPLQCATTSAVLNLNFGQRPFTYTPPTGFLRLNTFNL